MVNTKLEKVTADIEKTKEKISELQEKLRALELSRAELEDGQILSIVRNMNVSVMELAAFMETLKKGLPSGLPEQKGTVLVLEEDSHADKNIE